MSHSEPDLLRRAYACLEAGDPGGAEQLCQQILALEPRSAGAQHLIGLLALDRGQFPAAEAAFRSALSAAPRDPFYCADLGRVLLAQGRPQEAEPLLQQAVQLEPDSAVRHFNLGVVSAFLERFEQARSSLREAVRLDPDLADANYNLGVMADRQGDRAGALAHFLEALRVRPQDQSLQYVVASLGDGKPPSKAPPSYVLGVFDKAAEAYDQRMVQVLGYRIPERLRRLAAELLPLQPLDILDLGCGTGLCGLHFKDLARSLVGVDLSPNMVAKARERGLYDRLVCGDITGPPLVEDSRFDLVIAAEVFVYVGEPLPVFRTASDALRTGGVFLFTVEVSSGESFVLQATGRFSHSPAFVRDVACAIGFRELFFEPVILRTEKDVPVHGCVFAFQKSGDTPGHF